MDAVPLSSVFRATLPNGERVFFVDWNFGNRCHYACSYCPPVLHDGSVAVTPLERCVAFCRWIVDGTAGRGLRPHFHFSGGEPTIYAEFILLLAEIRERAFGTASVVSNGARPTAWWRRAAPLLDHITFSVHVEYVDLERLSETIAAVIMETRVHVNIPAPPERFDECLGHFETLAECFPSLSVGLKPILKGFGTELADYSPDQLEKLQRKRVTSSDNSGMIPRPLILIDADGRERAGSAASLVAERRNVFTGWQCFAGVESLAVTVGGCIYRGICKEGGELGNINGDLPDIPVAPVTCSKARCKCLTDIPIRKYAQPV